VIELGLARSTTSALEELGTAGEFPRRHHNCAGATRVGAFASLTAGQGTWANQAKLPELTSSFQRG
jgi:hypothetical protein